MLRAVAPPLHNKCRGWRHMFVTEKIDHVCARLWRFSFHPPRASHRGKPPNFIPIRVYAYTQNSHPRPRNRFHKRFDCASFILIRNDFWERDTVSVNARLVFVRFCSFSFVLVCFRSFSFVFVRFRSFLFVFVRFRSFSFVFVRFRSFLFVFVYFNLYSLDFVRFIENV